MTKDKNLFFANSKKKLYRRSSLTIAKTRMKNLVPILLFVSSVFLLSYLQNTGTVVATTIPSLDQSIEQVQKSLQSSINKEIQSIDNITSNINCMNDVSIQTQTNNNSQTSSTTKNTCNNNSLFSITSSNPAINKNLSGAITSAEYDLKTGKIINSIFGNWSLKTNNDSQIAFNSTFTTQPLNVSPNQNESTSLANQTSVAMNKTEYNLSNFRVNTVMQQDSDITYKGTIDVVEKVLSSGSNASTATNTFKGTDVSISILDGRILVINFDKQTSLFNQFKDISLAGVVMT